MKRYQLCQCCPEYVSCQEICSEAIEFESQESDPDDRQTGKYEPKGVPLVSYQESRLTKQCDNQPLDFNL